MSKAEVSIVLPCLNEEDGIAFCIDRISEVVERHGIDAELIIVDNASDDRTAEIVREKMQSIPWLRLEREDARGYGSAYLRGLNAADGTYIYMADADGSYDFDDIPLFIEKMKAKESGKKEVDMVIGNRFNSVKGKEMEKDAMPWLHRRVGNPILSGLVRLFFKVRVHDIHCGARAMTKKAFEKMDLHTRGMEFASEMIIKASKVGLNIEEVPTHYKTRIGTSKLRSFADGWRHLRFILLYSPLILFMLPGALLFAVGLISMIALYFWHISIWNISLYVHPMFFSAVILITGYQLILFGGFAKTYAVTHLGDTNHAIQSLFRHLTIEKAGIAGILLVLFGGIIYGHIAFSWIDSGFGSLDQIKNSIVALTLAVIGVQTFFSAFMLSIIGIKEIR